MLSGKSILVTGGTGSFGKIFLYKQFLVCIQRSRDTTKQDGTPRKLQDVSRMDWMGWKNTVELEEGIGKTYRWYQFNRGE